MPALPAALPLSIQPLRIHAQERLKAAGVENYLREADWLLAHALQLSLASLLTEKDRPMSPAEAAEAWRFIERRAAREPLQYILGSQEFKGWDIAVTSDVLIPRPETELLVDEALTILTRQPRPVLADVGTGSGCIAVAIAKARPDARVYAVDISEPAVAMAKANVVRHGLLRQVHVIQGNLLDTFATRRGGSFDVIISNPPYIPEAECKLLEPEVGRYEPRMALAAGPDGLHFYRHILVSAPALLKSGGHVILELGFGQADNVRGLLEKRTELAVAHSRRDDAGIERVLVLKKAA